MMIAIAAGLMSTSVVIASPAADRAPAAGPTVFEGPVPASNCGAGSKPETALQGQVPREDRDSGRSQKGYWCNLELVGRYQGEGASWQADWYEHCAYYDTTFPGREESPGVQVIDARRPARPRFTTNLTTPSMLGPWESLKVNQKRGLLGGIAAWGPGEGPLAFFDVYDVKDDCAQPRLLASLPVSMPLGHNGNWAPDGKTYYATNRPGGLTAIDVSDPSSPRLITTTVIGILNHDLSFSPDGKRAYVAMPRLGNGEGNGLLILDVSDIQERALIPQVRTVSTLTWDDGSAAQSTIPVTIGGHPYLIFTDESGTGVTRIIDIEDETRPRIVSKLRLEIHMPEHAGQRAADTAGTGLFGYEGHYCGVDRLKEARALACGYFQSGIRVFDIRNPMKPKEIAYFNPPAQLGKNDELTGSEHASSPLSVGAELSADWCSAQVRFYKKQLWTTCQDNGFLILRFTNTVWPFAEKR